MKRKKEEIVIITKEVTRYENCKNFSSKNTIYFFLFFPKVKITQQLKSL